MNETIDVKRLLGPCFPPSFPFLVLFQSFLLPEPGSQQLPRLLSFDSIFQFSELFVAQMTPPASPLAMDKARRRHLPALRRLGKLIEQADPLSVGLGSAFLVAVARLANLS